MQNFEGCIVNQQSHAADEQDFFLIRGKLAYCLWILAQFIFFTMSLIGNVAVIISMNTEKKLRKKSTYSFIISIAATNFIISLSLLVVAKVLKIGPNLPIIPIFSSMILVQLNLHTALSIDRYWAICFPFSYLVEKKLGHKKWIIIICVLSGLCLGMLQMTGWNSGCRSINEYFSRGYLIVLSAWLAVSDCAIISLCYLTLSVLSAHVRGHSSFG